MTSKASGGDIGLGGGDVLEQGEPLAHRLELAHIHEHGDAAAVLGEQQRATGLADAAHEAGDAGAENRKVGGYPHRA